MHDEELARKLHFNSVEEMHNQLKDWDLPDWLIGVETNSGKGKARGKGTPRRLRSLGPGKELPPFGNATELIRQHLEALLKRAELLKQMDESLHGRQFVLQDVESATVLISREHMSKVGWEAACEQHGLDPDGEDEEIWDTNAVAKLPGGVALSPTEDETILIGVCALAGGEHNPVWQNEGFSEEPVRDETAVHTLEHGAVWITYQPDLPEGQKEAIRELVEGQTCLLASPYEDLDSPVVASAWGKQLRLESAEDSELESFIGAYRQGPQTPEPGATCTGGTADPA
jgi:hypothetical protein